MKRKQVLAQPRARADGAAGARGTRQQRLRLKRWWLVRGSRPRWKEAGAAVELWKRRREQSWTVLTRETLELESTKEYGHDPAASGERAAVLTLKLMSGWAAGVWGSGAPTPEAHTGQNTTPKIHDSHSVVQKIPEKCICYQQTWLNWLNETTVSHVCLNTWVWVCCTALVHIRPASPTWVPVTDWSMFKIEWPCEDSDSWIQSTEQTLSLLKRHICAAYSHKSLQVCSLVSSFATVNKSREKSKTEEIFLRVCSDGPQGLLCTISICGLIHIL